MEGTYEHISADEGGYSCDVSEAFQCFSDDVTAGEAKDYNTGDALPDFVLAAAKIEWDKLGETGRNSHRGLRLFIDDRGAMQVLPQRRAAAF